MFKEIEHFMRNSKEVLPLQKRPAGEHVKGHILEEVHVIAAAVLYLLLPYTGMFVREVDHVWPMAIIVSDAAKHTAPAAAQIVGSRASSAVHTMMVSTPR